SLFMATILVDNFTAAFSSVAFVSFISWLSGRAFSASQYALLACLGSLGRTSLSSFSGQMVDSLGGNWALFFVITALMVIPGLLLLLLSARFLNAVSGAPCRKEMDQLFQPNRNKLTLPLWISTPSAVK